MADKQNGPMTNGSGKPKEDKVLQFPTLADRTRARRGKERHGGENQRPFFDFSKIPPFTKGLVALLVLIQLVLGVIDENLQYKIFYTFGFVPAYFSGAVHGFPKIAYVSPITHMFLHAGWMHLAFNTIMVLTFGILFEREFGARRTALFWLLCGLAGAGVYFVLNPALASPVIGASGSISGLFAASILFLHDQKQRMGAVSGRGPLPLLVFWLAFMVFTGMISSDNTAWQAHVGGFLCGAGLYLWFRAKARGRF